MPGIEESRELILALGEVKKIIMAELADGFQFTEDVPAIVVKLEQSKAVASAIEGIEHVLPELKDLSLAEKVSLVVTLIKAMI